MAHMRVMRAKAKDTQAAQAWSLEAPIELCTYPVDSVINLRI